MFKTKGILTTLEHSCNPKQNEIKFPELTPKYMRRYARFGTTYRI